MRYDLLSLYAPKLSANDYPEIHDSRPNIPNFIDTYIFPGGYLPTASILLQSIHSGSSGMLEIRTVESIGPHYAKTLRSWRENFQANWERDIKPRLLQQKMDDGKKGADGASQAERQKKLEWELGVLKRKWEVRFSLFVFVCVQEFHDCHGWATYR
jgi:cyclopropane-fatty-acyl-phospholipid synthase